MGDSLVSRFLLIYIIMLKAATWTYPTQEHKVTVVSTAVKRISLLFVKVLKITPAQVTPYKALFSGL